MNEDDMNLSQERPSYSPIPPDQPPKKGGAAVAVILTAILILIIAGIGIGAYLLLNTDSRANERARNSMTPAEYLLWVESNSVEERREALLEAAQKNGSASPENGTGRHLVIDAAFTDSFAQEMGLSGPGHFSVTLDSSLQDNLMGLNSALLYGGTEIFRASLSTNPSQNLALLRIPEFAEGWYDLSSLYDSGSPGGVFLTSLADSMFGYSDAGADPAQAAVRGLEFSWELYQTALSYFDSYELQTDIAVKANNVESSYTQITASIPVPGACDMAEELISLIRESDYVSDVLYSGRPDEAQAFLDSLAQLSSQLPAISASFSEADVLTYLVWVDDEGTVRGRELSFSSSGVPVLSAGFRLSVDGRTFGYSAYLTAMSDTLLDIHGSASGRSDSLTGDVTVTIPTYLYYDTYTDPIELAAEFEDLNIGTSHPSGEILFSLHIPEEIAGDLPADEWSRYHIRLSLPEDDAERPTLTLLDYGEEQLILTVTETLTEDAFAVEFADASDTVYNAETADQYFSRENWLAFLDLAEQRMNEPGLADFFESLRNASADGDAWNDSDADDDSWNGSGTDIGSGSGSADGEAFNPENGGSSSGSGSAALTDYPSMAAVSINGRTLTTRDLPYYFVDFMEDYSFYEQAELDEYGEELIKQEILSRIHITLACSEAARDAGLSLSDEDLADLENRYDAWIDYPYIAENTEHDTWPWNADSLRQALSDVILAEKYRDYILAQEGFDEEAVAASVPVPLTWEVEEFTLYKSILNEIDMTEEELFTCLEATIAYYNDELSDEIKQRSIQQDNLIFPWLDCFEMVFPETDWWPFYSAVTGGYGYLDWYTHVALTPDNTYYPDELKAILDGTEDGELSGVMDFGDSFLFFYQWETYEDPEEYELAKYFAVEEAKQARFADRIDDIVSEYPLSTMPGWFLIEPGDFVYQSIIPGQFLRTGQRAGGS